MVNLRCGVLLVAATIFLYAAAQDAEKACELIGSLDDVKHDKLLRAEKNARDLYHTGGNKLFQGMRDARRHISSSMSTILGIKEDEAAAINVTHYETFHSEFCDMRDMLLDYGKFQTTQKRDVLRDYLLGVIKLQRSSHAEIMNLLTQDTASGLLYDSSDLTYSAAIFKEAMLAAGKLARYRAPYADLVAGVVSLIDAAKTFHLHWNTSTPEQIVDYLNVTGTFNEERWNATEGIYEHDDVHSEDIVDLLTEVLNYLKSLEFWFDPNYQFDQVYNKLVEAYDVFRKLGGGIESLTYAIDDFHVVKIPSSCNSVEVEDAEIAAAAYLQGLDPEFKPWV